METVLQLTKRLASRPTIDASGGVIIRTFCDVGHDDVDRWIAIRSRAFARQRIGVREWDRADFDRELRQKWWWRPERTWMAQVQPDPHGESLTVGTITLAFRGSEADALPAIHWLTMLPEFRRGGIARRLVATLEAACWDQGWREVALETHVGWIEAAKFYAALGYQPTS